MKLIIDIDESTYKRLKEYYDAGNYGPVSEFAIANGTPLQEELEKIKAEIEEKEFELNCATMSDVALKTAYIEAVKIVDNHISELKGENKEKPFDRTDDCLSYEESFCEARDCGECCCRE